MEDEELMEFAFINALFLFLIIPILIFIYYKYNINKIESVLKFSSLKIIKKTDVKRNLIRKHIPFVLVIISLSLIIIALANPQLVSIGVEKGINLGIVLDGSESMAATDYKQTRLEASKNAINPWTLLNMSFCCCIGSAIIKFYNLDYHLLEIVVFLLLIH